jgi:hypothetical protein
LVEHSREKRNERHRWYRGLWHNLVAAVYVQKSGLAREEPVKRHRLLAALAVAFCCCAIAGVGQANTSYVAPGFASLPRGGSVLLVEPNVKVYSEDAVLQADRTETAISHMRAALLSKTAAMSLKARELSKAQMQNAAEVSALHGVVGRSIAMHLYPPNRLASKAAQLDWSFGEATAPLREMSGADYALFIWIRNAQANAGTGLAALAIGLARGKFTDEVQVGHASLVDLRTGRILWFDHVNRAGRDLIEPASAVEIVSRLLRFFPVAP